MASYKDKLSFQDNAEIIMALCQAAVNSMGLKIATQERHRLVVREVAVQGQTLQIPVQLEIKVLPLSSGCGLELTASNVGFGAAQTQRVQAMVTAFARQIDFEMDRPNMQRAQEEEELAKLAEKQRKREREEQAEAEEAAQRARARALVMQQLSGKAPAPAAEPGEDGEADDADAAPAPEPSIEDLTAMLLPHSAPAAPRSVSPVAAQPVMAPVAPAVSQDDFVANLERLANLHKMGALSDDEFKAAKNRLLGI